MRVRGVVARQIVLTESHNLAGRVRVRRCENCRVVVILGQSPVSANVVGLFEDLEWQSRQLELSGHRQTRSARSNDRDFSGHVNHPSREMRVVQGGIPRTRYRPVARYWVDPAQHYLSNVGRWPQKQPSPGVRALTETTGRRRW